MLFGYRARRRRAPLAWGALFVYPAAGAAALAACALLLAAQGKPALAGVGILFAGAFGDLWALQDCVLKAIPIFLCALGAAICFRMQVWNIGAEGQYALGAVGAAGAALFFPDLPWWALLPLMLLSAMALGGAWAFIPALLKLKLKVNEIIATLMLNYVGVLILEYLVYGPWKDPASHGFPYTAQFPAAAVVGQIPGSRIHWGAIFCLAAGLALSFVMRRTRLGFELKVSGEGARLSSYARLPHGLLTLGAMTACGALAGAAGFLETSAVVGRLQPSVMAGYGYTAIVVAWMARLAPLNIGLAAFLLAALRVGVEGLRLELQVPAAFGGMLEGLALLCVLAGQFFMEYALVRAPSASSTASQEARS